MKMKNQFSSAPRRSLLAAGALGLSLGAMLASPSVPSAQAAKVVTPILEVWPGQRVVMVLPLQVGADWKPSPELTDAILPLMRPQLLRALSDTGKFSVTVPYRLDPILRRAVLDSRVPQETITALIDTPSLANAQSVLSKLTFNQAPMVAELQLEDLRVGGTPQKPTVALQVSGKLYEVGGSGPFRSVVYTSRSFGGKTPEARLQAAADDAFRYIAREFVKPPESFQLALNAATSPAPAMDKMAPPKTATPPATSAPKTMPSTAPPTPAPAPLKGTLIPTLPPAQPPLGLAVPGEPTMAR